MNGQHDRDDSSSHARDWASEMNKVLAMMRNVVIIAIHSENAYLTDKVGKVVPPPREYGACRLDCNVIVGIPPGLNFESWIPLLNDILVDARSTPI